MAGVGVGHVEFDAPALRELERQIGAAASRRRLQLLLDSLAQAGGETARDRVKRGGPAPDGAAWPPRSALSRSRKPLLNRAGDLGDSISSASTSRTARWGTNRVYARIHQLGGVVRPRRRRALRFESGRELVFARRVTIPARPYLGWGDEEERQANQVVRRWFDGALPGGGQ